VLAARPTGGLVGVVVGVGERPKSRVESRLCAASHASYGRPLATGDGRDVHHAETAEPVDGDPDRGGARRWNRVVYYGHLITVNNC